MSNSPTNLQLYNRVKAEAKRKFDVWPSAYASGWLVQEYKRRGGKYGSRRKVASRSSRRKVASRQRSSRQRSSRQRSRGSLSRWFDEKWVDVCHWPKKVPCGRSKAKRSKYPYCRPSKRVSPKTPRTVQELSAAERKSRCSRKRRNPYKKI